MPERPCLTCGMSNHNSIHKNEKQFGYHLWVDSPPKEGWDTDENGPGYVEFYRKTGD